MLFPGGHTWGVSLRYGVGCCHVEMSESKIESLQCCFRSRDVPQVRPKESSGLKREGSTPSRLHRALSPWRRRYSEIGKAQVNRSP